MSGENLINMSKLMFASKGKSPKVPENRDHNLLMDDLGEMLGAKEYDDPTHYVYANAWRVHKYLGELHQKAGMPKEAKKHYDMASSLRDQLNESKKFGYDNG